MKHLPELITLGALLVAVLLSVIIIRRGYQPHGPPGPRPKPGSRLELWHVPSMETRDLTFRPFYPLGHKLCTLTKELLKDCVLPCEPWPRPHRIPRLSRLWFVDQGLTDGTYRVWVITPALANRTEHKVTLVKGQVTSYETRLLGPPTNTDPGRTP